SDNRCPMSLRSSLATGARTTHEEAMPQLLGRTCEAVVLPWAAISQAPSGSAARLMMRAVRALLAVGVHIAITTEEDLARLAANLPESNIGPGVLWICAEGGAELWEFSTARRTCIWRASPGTQQTAMDQVSLLLSRRGIGRGLILTTGSTDAATTLALLSEQSERRRHRRVP